MNVVLNLDISNWTDIGL